MKYISWCLPVGFVLLSVAPLSAAPMTMDQSITAGAATVNLADCTSCDGLTFSALASPSTGFVIARPQGDVVGPHGQDVSAFFEVVSTQDIRSVLLSVNGTGDGGVGETITSNTGCLLGSGFAGAGSTSTVTLDFASCDNASHNDIFITKDISAMAGSVGSVSQTIEVPEPASAALLGAGLLGLIWRRRRSA